MDEAGFRKFLKRTGKQAHVIDALVSQARAFEEHLLARQGISLAEASELHLRAYLDGLQVDEGRVPLRGIALYFTFSGSTNLAELASSLREARVASGRKAILLRDFRGVNPADAERLSALGVRSTMDLLRLGSTPEDRQKLADQAGVAGEAILDLVKLSDLSRIEGVKGIRARLYVDAGVDTLDKLATWEPEALRQMLLAWVARTGFAGIAPLPRELVNTIAAARRLPRLVTY